MINNVFNSIESAKSKLSIMLENMPDGVPCTYKQSGRVISGFVIAHTDAVGKDIYKLIRPDIRVRSHTGKEYFVLLSSIITVEGLEEL